jgi:hypothetical protein
MNQLVQGRLALRRKHKRSGFRIVRIKRTWHEIHVPNHAPPPLISGPAPCEPGNGVAIHWSGGKDDHDIGDGEWLGDC